MKDSELQKIVLNWFYEKRRGAQAFPRAEDFPSLPYADVMRACDQLGENDLITWKSIKRAGVTQHGFGKINGPGVELIESGGTSAPKSEPLVHNNFNFSAPSNVQVGDHNSQSVVQAFTSIIEQIDASSGTPAEKAEAKSRLAKFLEHPLVTNTVSGAARLLTQLALKGTVGG